ncbi:transposase [Xanthobacter autotrophicus]|uniref:transposase n=1 Tax=Xanthobacter autotrophicus TaxID=280 RepID=UPI00372A3BAD
MLESGAQGGRPPCDHRRVLDAVLWATRTGSPWRAFFSASTGLRIVRTCSV